MIDELITFETAKLAKEKGFDENALSFYNEDGSDLNPLQDNINYYDKFKKCTQSLLQRWLREEHNIQVYVNSHTRHGPARTYWKDYIAYVDNFAINDARDEEFQTYEEALEVGLYHALEKILQ